MICRSIWFRRNQVWHKHPTYPFSQLFFQVSQALQDFQQTLSLPSAPVIPQVYWIPPPVSSFKLNFDGALLQDINVVGLRVIFRDHQEQVIASIAEKVCLPQSSDEVEALAVAKAISFALDIGLNSIIVEGDSEVIINFLQHEEALFATFGHLISTTKVSIVACSSIFFSHTHILSNFIAYNLAKHTRHISSYLVLMEGVPPHLSNVLFAHFG